MSAQPVRPLPGREPSPLAELRARISSLADLLLEVPPPDRAELRFRAQELYRGAQHLGLDAGLALLVLRNLIRDAADPAAVLDAPYHANQLVRAVDQLHEG